MTREDKKATFTSNAAAKLTGLTAEPPVAADILAGEASPIATQAPSLLAEIPGLDEAVPDMIADLGFPRALGVTDNDAAVPLALQMLESMAPLSKERAAVASLALLREIQPNSVLEGMLALQMVGVHNAAMELLRSATEHGLGGDYGDRMLGRAGKFLRLFTDQLDALARVRGKPREQRVTVDMCTCMRGVRRL